jgi:hypothetical protein
MWLYQELLVQLRPTLVIEFGTFQGGSALYFATILSALPPGAAPHKFKVLTVDIHGDLLHPSVAADARIEAVTASSIDALVEQRVRELQQQCVQSHRPPLQASLVPLPSSPYILQVSRPRVRYTGQRPQQGARAAGAARHRAPHLQRRPRGRGRQVCARCPCPLTPHALTARSNVNGHPVGRSHGPGPYVAPPPPLPVVYFCNIHAGTRQSKPFFRKPRMCSLRTRQQK